MLCSLYEKQRFGRTYHLHLRGRKSAEQETRVQEVEGARRCQQEQERKHGSGGHPCDPSPGNTDEGTLDWDILVRAAVNCKLCELAIAH
jgi:hypothetical protein